MVIRMDRRSLVVMDSYGFCGQIKLEQQLDTILHLIEMVGEDDFMSEDDYEEYIIPIGKLIKELGKIVRHNALYYTAEKDKYEWDEG